VSLEGGKSVRGDAGTLIAVLVIIILVVVLLNLLGLDLL
jgi:hypothetical protein